MVNQTRNLQFLPEIFRTETNDSFLGQTLDTLTSKPDLIRVEGFVGENYGIAVSQTDKYVVEPSTERQNYQLTPSVTFLKDSTQSAKDTIDYPNIIRALSNQGAVTNNHTRLFENEFYSWDSFIDLDKFVNYGQYYWLPTGPDAVTVSGTIDVNNTILGKTQYTSPTGIPFVNGLKVIFSSPVQAGYVNTYYYVEGVGESIQLVPVEDLKVIEPTSGQLYQPWGGSGWGGQLAWDVELRVPINVEYILINRASRDRNAWSRTNRWFSQTVIDISKQFNGGVSSIDYSKITRASRPIIEFYRDLKLINSGTESAGMVNYIDTTTLDPLTLNGQPSCILNQSNPAISVTALDGERVIFAASTLTSDRASVWIVNYVLGSVVLTQVPIGDSSLAAIIGGPSIYAGISMTYSSASGQWTASQSKSSLNQAPLFDVFDSNGISYGDQTVYTNTTFDGTKLFSYAIGTGTNDPVLGFAVSYNKLNNLGDINFDINLNKDTFTYGDTGAGITSQISNGFIHQSSSYGIFDEKTGWVKSAAESVQRQVFNFSIESDSDSVLCDVIADTVSEWSSTSVYLNGEIVDTSDYTVSVDAILNTTTILFNSTLSVGNSVSVLLFSNQVSKTAYYEVPTNLQNNPFNTNVTTLTMGGIRRHFSTIFANAPSVTGQQFGVNNIGELGNLSRYGTSIIQSSAPLVLPSIFLRKPNYSLVDALRFNSIEYEKYKALIIDVAYNGDYSVYQTPAQVLDNIIAQITMSKTSTDSFFWTDMLPSGSPSSSSSTVITSPATSISITLSISHDFTAANYNAVCVYVTRTVSDRALTTQLIKGIDYTIVGTTLTATYQFLTDDVVSVNEYNQTYGSYVPSTPTKLGMYQATIPTVLTDNTYNQPTTFIVGHDGSYTRLYGTYVDGRFDDFRDMALFEFETRVYNNLKVNGELPLSYTDVFPGEFRTTDYSRDELLTAYTENFMAWVGRNKVDYKTQVYNRANQFTYNYNQSSYTSTGKVMTSGYWRGIYRWLYDTTNPADAPWEMLGFTTKPTWWAAQYGNAPYLPANTMWSDLRDGIVRDPAGSYVDSARVRPQLLSILPVDNAGALVSPMANIIGNFKETTFNRNWIVGDEGPTESSYLRSSTWAFDLMALLSVSKPAKFYNLYADIDNYKYNTVFGQYLYGGRSHIDARNITVYGNGVIKHSYINWVVDYLNQWGIDGKDDVVTTLANLDVRLSYRLAGFSDKQYLRFFIERSTPSSTTPRLLIPDDSYDVILYDNAPENKITYSSVIIQKTTQGYTVWGNSTTLPYFRVSTSEAGPLETFRIGTESVTVNTLYSSTNSSPVAYGTLYYSIQGVCEFMRGYGHFLENSGVVFDKIKNGQTVDWTKMITEFINWAQQSWEVGSILSLNPSATEFTTYKPGLVVQPLTISNNNYILNQNMAPLQVENYSVMRQNENFKIKVLSVGDAIAYTNLNLNSIEHVVVFSNTTQFSDVIYDLEAGIRQNRIVMSGKKTAGWSGFVKTDGFILNENDVQLWSKQTKYAKGQIVEFKNSYYSALEPIKPGAEFDYSQWSITNYGKIKVGLLPNPTTRAYEGIKFYDLREANLSQDEDLLAFGLIGFRPRQYLSDAELADISQVNLYINMIRGKGTITTANAFKNANLSQGKIDYNIRENWAIKNSDFGATGSNQFVEFELNGDVLSGNPAIASFTTSVPVVGAQQSVLLSDLINYYEEPTSANILPSYSTQYSVERGLPTAGYVNKNDVKLTSYLYDDLNLNLSDLDTLYVGNYVWLANHQNSWSVLTPQSLTVTLISASNNLDGTINLTFSADHGLADKDMIVIVDFDSTINGFYQVSTVVSLTTITVPATLSKTVKQITGTGIAMRMASARVSQASDLASRSLTGTTKFTTSLGWVDATISGDWQVMARGPVFKSQTTLSSLDGNNYPIEDTGVRMGSRVAYTSSVGRLATDATGLLYRNGTVVTDSFGTPIFAQFGIRASGNFIYGGTLGTGTVPPYTWSAGGWGSYPWSAGGTSNSTPIINVYDFSTGVFVFVGTIDVGLGQPSSPPAVEITDFDISEDRNWVFISNLAAGLVYSFSKNQLGGYDYSSTLIAPVDVSSSQWGHTIATNYDGTKVIVGAPKKVINGIPSAGIAEIYNRSSERTLASYSEWISGTAYVVGDTVAYLGVFYRCLTNNSDVVFTIGNWSVSSYEYVAQGIVINPEITINGVPTTAYTLSSTTTNTTISFTALPEIGDDILINYGALTLQQRTQRLELSNGVYVAQPENGAMYGQSVTTNKYGAEMMVGCPYGITVLVTNEQTEGAVYRWTNTGQRYGSVVAKIPSPTVNTTILINGFRVIISVSEATISLAASKIADAINLSDPTDVIATATGEVVTISTKYSTASSPGDILDIVGTSATFTQVGDVWINDSLVTLGIQPYTNTQVIASPDLGVNTAFGWSINLSKGSVAGDSLVVASTTANGLVNTTFDYDDDLVDDDTIFDHGATTFIDTVTRSGSVYMFDYLQSSTETSANHGNYVFGQYCFSIDQYFQYTSTRNGESSTVAFNDGTVIVGNPSWYPTMTSPTSGYPNGLGRVVTYSAIDRDSSWYIYREPSSRVDINKINSAIIYDTNTNENLEFLDHIDPVQGKLLNVVATNVDYRGEVDPATYSGGLVWGSEQEGNIWLDTSNIRLLNYHQTDLVYNATNWGKTFPGSTADVYVWVTSVTEPVNYIGRGYVVDFDKYTSSSVLDRATNSLVTMYHFWVKGYDRVPTSKTLSPQVLSQYIIDPQSSGISFIAPISTDTVALYNCNDAIQTTGSALHLGYSSGVMSDSAHTDWTLIQDGSSIDFLHGVPETTINDPESLYLKYLNSFMGYQLDGLSVPDTNLPALLQHGVSFRPRQTMFTDRLEALKNYIDYANGVMINYPLVESRGTYLIDLSSRVTAVAGPTDILTLDSTVGMMPGQAFKFTASIPAGLNSGTYYINSIDGNDITFTAKIGDSPITITGPIDTNCDLWSPRNYVKTVDWWAAGYDGSTKPMIEVSNYNELLTVGYNELYGGVTPLFLTLYDGLIGRVKDNGHGRAETYVWKQATGWVRIGLTNGTYQISDDIYNVQQVSSVAFTWDKFAWSNAGWDRGLNVTPPVPVLEIYYIIRWITEQVFTDELKIENNRSLMLMFNVIQSQSNQQHNFLPWLNKTSLVDVDHTVRKLLPYKLYQQDNQNLVADYINEVKPYHVYVKNFIYKFTGNEHVGMSVTDNVNLNVTSMANPGVVDYKFTINVDKNHTGSALLVGKVVLPSNRVIINTSDQTTVGDVYRNGTKLVLNTDYKVAVSLPNETHVVMMAASGIVAGDTIDISLNASMYNMNWSDPGTTLLASTTSAAKFLTS